ncbi:MAG: hypothetical protein JEY96_19230 [Bacteroidales bacterium]|nr:hypothetical protein [Bacteroidales bacterium]
MDNEIINIEDNLYSDKNESECILETTKIILKKVDEEFVDKVVRIKIKGQIDGN